MQIIDPPRKRLRRFRSFPSAATLEARRKRQQRRLEHFLRWERIFLEISGLVYEQQGLSAAKPFLQQAKYFYRRRRTGGRYCRTTRR